MWSLFAAVGLFVAGGVFSVYHGVEQWTSQQPPKHFVIGYVVLAIALVLEGASLLQATRRTRREAADLGRDALDHALSTSDPTLRAVLAEDSVAVLGIVVVAGGMALHQATGNGHYDALASIVVGLALCAAAAFLIDRNRRFLTGEVADDQIVAGVRQRICALPAVARLTYLRLEYVGPHQLELVAAFDLAGDRPESEVAATLRECEGVLESDPRIVDAVLTLALPEEVERPQPAAASSAAGSRPA